MPPIAVSRFIRFEDGAVAVDWTTLTASTAGLGLATLAVVSGGLQTLTNDVRNLIEGTTISASFRDTIENVCGNGGLGAGPSAGVTGATYQGLPVNALLIYQASDFIGGLPAESGAVAGGGGSQTLTLSPNAQPILLLIADDDSALHEVDGSQVLAETVEINGQIYEAGYDISAAYTLSASGTGLTLSALHMGDSFHGTTQGAVYATAASSPLEPGATYEFDGNITTHNHELPYSVYLGCV